MKRFHGSRLPSFLSHLSLLRLTSHLSLLTLFLLLCTPAVVFSQQRWERNYGGVGYDFGYSVQQTTDGGYIVAGYTQSFGNYYQVYLIRTNASGDTLWTRTYGGTSIEWGYSVQQTSDGGYIVTGGTTSFGNDEQVYLIKTNASGDTLWTRNYGGAVRDRGNSVQQTFDGGYIVVGNTNSFGSGYQVYLIKTDTDGDTLWTQTYGGVGSFGYSVQQTSDSGYIVAGNDSSLDVYLIKTNASGDTLWSKTYGGTSIEWGYSVQQTSDTGFIVAGGTTSFGNSDQVYLIKTNASGDTLWTRNYGGTGRERGNAVQQTSDGGYIVAGYAESFGNDFQVYLIKTNASGDTLWTGNYGGAGNDGGYSVQQTSDGGYIVAGRTESFGDSVQVYLIKTDANGSSGVEVSPSHESRVASYGVFPNPFVSFAYVPGREQERFALYDISGRKVGVYKGDRIGEGLSAGVYFLRPFGEYAKPIRIVKLR